MIKIKRFSFKANSFYLAGIHFFVMMLIIMIIMMTTLSQLAWTWTNFKSFLFHE